jgi:hypothetical protein
MCNNCISQGEYCILGSWIACRACNQHKVRCSFSDGKQKCKGEEIISNDGEPRPKKAKVLVTRLSGSKLMVEILAGPSRIADLQPFSEMVELLQELISGICDLSKVTWGLVGLSIHMHKQHAEMIKLRKRQVFLAEQARKTGLGSGLGSDLGTEQGKEGKGGRTKEKGKRRKRR